MNWKAKTASCREINIGLAIADVTAGWPFAKLQTGYSKNAAGVTAKVTSRLLSLRLEGLLYILKSGTVEPRMVSSVMIGAGTKNLPLIGGDSVWDVPLTQHDRAEVN